LVLVLSFPGWAAAKNDGKPFGRIVVFGTSLSDPGNAFAFLGDANTPPYADLDQYLVPGMPYAKGGHHFSNGATWVERLAKSLGLAGDARPAFQGGAKATNYAVGGTRARDDGMNFTLSQQVGAFLQDFDGAAPSDALYVIEMGGNDVRDALLVYLSLGPAGADAVLQQAVGSIGACIAALHTAGARRFLVWNAPNIALTPSLRMLDQAFPGAAWLGLQLTLGFNAYLDAGLAPLSYLDGIEILRLDVFGLLNAIAERPSDFGLDNAIDACVMPNVPPFACQKPDEYLFWDGIHPTRAVHAIVAHEAAAVLAK
jgi:outer membrane lipase/esterase